MMDGVNVPMIKFHLNGADVSVVAAAGERLSASLREKCGAKDVKIGCNAGDCGACSVLVDGNVVCACLMKIVCELIDLQVQHQVQVRHLFGKKKAGGTVC